MKRYAKQILAVILTLMIVISGCGVQKQPEIDSQESSLPLENKDILSCKWTLINEEAKEVKGWEIEQYIPVDQSVVNETCLIREKMDFFSGNSLYEIVEWEGYSDEELKYRFELDVVDLSSGEQSILIPSLSQIDFRGKLEKFLADELVASLMSRRAYVISLDVNEEELHLFVPVWDSTWTINHYYDIAFSLEGELLEVNDYGESLWPVETRTAGMFQVPKAVRGETGKIFFYDEEKNEIYKVNQENKVESTVCIDDAVNATLKMIGKDSNKIPIFSVVKKGIGVDIFTLGDNCINTVFQGSQLNGIKRTDAFGNVVILQGNRLLLWDVEKGFLSDIYHFEGLGIYTCTDIFRNSEGMIYLCFTDGENSFIYQLQEGEHSELIELVLLQNVEDKYTATCAAEYNRTHPGVKILVDVMDQSQEYNWTKLVESMKSGEGPDLLLLNRKQLTLLQEADILSPLDSYLSSDLRENIFAGALQFGEYTNGLYAIPYEATVGTLMVKDKYWKEDHWNLYEMLGAFETWKEENPSGERVEAIYFPLSSSQLLYDFLIQGTEYCEFVDLEKKTCNFTNDNFYKLLRFCKDECDKNSMGTYYSNEELMSDFASDRIFTYYVGGGLGIFSTARRSLGDNVHVVGYPMTNGVKSFVHCYRGVALSSLSVNKEVAADFLMSLVSEENQVRYSQNWIRKDVLAQHVKNGEKGVEGKETPYFELNHGAVIPLDGKEDGTSYLDEYMELMDEGKPLTVQTDIRDIILEEAESYFVGNKSEKEVAKIIQSRVQLYLDE